MYHSVVQETETEDSVCLQPKKVGPCRGKLPRFYFNSKTKICEQFNYGGCKHNDNNFKTEEDCKDKCISNWERGYKELKILPSSCITFFFIIEILNCRVSQMWSISVVSYCRESKSHAFYEAYFPFYQIY